MVGEKLVIFNESDGIMHSYIETCAGKVHDYQNRHPNEIERLVFEALDDGCSIEPIKTDVRKLSGKLLYGLSAENVERVQEAERKYKERAASEGAQKSEFKPREKYPAPPSASGDPAVNIGDSVDESPE